MDEAGNEALQEAIKNMQGVEATWVESVPVKEIFGAHVVWDGEVQVFDLVDHPTARRAFAWSRTTEGTRRRFHVVLQLGRVTDAATAVRTAIASVVRRGGR